MTSTQTDINQGQHCNENFSVLLDENSSTSDETRTFVEAFIDRYDNMEGDLEFARDLNIHFVLQGTSPQRLPNGRVAASYSLCLDKYSIRDLGSLDYIRETCQRVTTLTLAENKIESWTFFFKLLQCLPNLRQVDLSGNRLDAQINSNVISNTLRADTIQHSLTYLSLTFNDSQKRGSLISAKSHLKWSRRLVLHFHYAFLELLIEQKSAYKIWGCSRSNGCGLSNWSLIQGNKDYRVPTWPKTYFISMGIGYRI